MFDFATNAMQEARTPVRRPCECKFFITSRVYLWSMQKSACKRDGATRSGRAWTKCAHNWKITCIWLHFQISMLNMPPHWVCAFSEIYIYSDVNVKNGVFKRWSFGDLKWRDFGGFSLANINEDVRRMINDVLCTELFRYFLLLFLLLMLFVQRCLRIANELDTPSFNAMKISCHANSNWTNRHPIGF